MKDTVRCKWCHKPTMMTMTQECDSCWELHRLIKAKPVIAMRMMVETPILVKEKDKTGEINE